MAVNYDAIQLGLVLGTNVQTINDLNQNVFDSENLSSLNIVGLNSIGIATLFMMKSNTLGTSSFVLDHPVYGALDSSTLSINGGYAGGSTLSDHLFVESSGGIFREYFTQLEFINTGLTTAVTTSIYYY